MARPRRPATTPFGLWLEGWLEDRPELTFDSFATDIQVTKTAISQWIAATRPIQIKHKTLIRIAGRTGVELSFLEGLIYGSTPGPRGGEGFVTLTRDELQGMLDAAADRAIERLLRERPSGLRVA